MQRMSEPSGNHSSQQGPASESSPAPHVRVRSLKQWSSGTVVLCALLLAVVFGGGMMAGWQFSSRGATGGDLQTGPRAASTLPATSGDSREVMREQVVANVRPSVVQINIRGINGNSVGSGVVIDRRGYIITNNHVVAGEQTIQVVFFNGRTLSATLTGTAPTDDLAVIHIDPTQVDLTVATLGDSTKVRVGQDVLVIGNPLGITQTVTSGIVSALGRNVETGTNGQILPSTIQTDAAINPGNSGGALVDMRGNLIGIPTLTAIDPEFKTPANGVGFAIPANRVRFIAPQLIQNGKVSRTGRAALEIQVADLDPVLAQKRQLPFTQGALVVGLTPNGAGEQAGIKVGDIIIEANNKPVSGVLSLGDALIDKNPGDHADVKVYRQNKQLTLDVHLGELPAK